MSSSAQRVVVSVQAHGFADKPWEGHLATGLLVDSDQVLVPALPAEVAEVTEGIELLVLPLPVGKAGRVERLEAARLRRAFTLPDAAAGEFALIRLANPSRYPPGIGEFAGSELDSALARHDGDLWAALETIGAVPPDARLAVTPDLLRVVPEVEQAQRRASLDEPAAALTPGNEDICKFIPVCRRA